MSEMIQVKEKIYKTHYNDWSSIQSFVYEVESVIAEKAELGYQNIKIDNSLENKIAFYAINGNYIFHAQTDSKRARS